MLTYKDAEEYIEVGFSLVPVFPGRKEPFRKLLPVVDGKRSWKPYQVEKATKDEMQGWFKQYDRLNMAVACGAVSGGLVVIDFDIDAETNWAKWCEMTRPLSKDLPVAQTGKGKHVYLRYRGEAVSTHLARTIAGGIMVESRGGGGLCMLPPSRHPNGHLYNWERGSAEEIPVVNHQQYFALMGAAASLNQMEEKIYVPRKRKARDMSQKNNACGVNKRLVAYAMAVLLRVKSHLAGVVSGGRNMELNRSSFILGKYVGAGLIERAAVEGVLEEACLQNGYILDDGQQAFERTMLSGLEAGEAQAIDLNVIMQRLDRG